VIVAATKDSRKPFGPGHGTTAGKPSGHGGTCTRVTVRTDDPPTKNGTDKGSEAVDKYIAEREQKRRIGVHVPKHTRYTPLNALPVTYGGTRMVEDQIIVLLRQGDEVMVLEVDDAAALRLKRLPLGAKVSVTAQGIKMRGRSR
jgi:hypothetical protein